MKATKPKSNTLIAAPIMVGLFIAAVFAAESSIEREYKTKTLLFALSSLFWAPGLAVYLTGYRWKNLAPGNRGAHKSDDPTAYRNAMIGYLLGAVAVLIFAILK